jgi:hypothetical protein
MNKAPYEIRYPSQGKIKVLSAYDRREAIGNAHIFPDSVIIRVSDGLWLNEPLSIDRKARLKKIHGM